MLYRSLEGIGEKVSALCLGTMNFGATMDEAESFRVLDAFTGMGGNLIDTARVYGAPDGAGFGASERVIGKWLRARGNRDQLFLSTKGGHPPLDDMARGRLGKAELQRDLDESLGDLGVERIDLYWLHRDDENLPVEEILETLGGFVRAGKIRAFGASNWSAGRLEAARGAAAAGNMPGFIADQPMWSLARNGDAADLLDKRLVQMEGELYGLHAKTGMLCVPYTAQAKGFFPKMAQGGEAALSAKARERYLIPENLKLLDAVKEICQETGLSAGAVALAFLTGQPDFTTIPIVGVSRLAQAAALAEAGDARLTKPQFEALLHLTGLAG